MQVTLDLPDDISAALEGQWQDLPRHALEALAAEGYRAGALTENQVRRLLGLDTRFQVHAFLKAHRVPLRYTEADLEDDMAAHRELDREAAVARLKLGIASMRFFSEGPLSGREELHDRD